MIWHHCIKIWAFLNRQPEILIKPNCTWLKLKVTINASNFRFHIEPTGYFTAIGNAVNPIRIQGRFESAGYWDGFDIRSNNPNNKMEYVVLKDGGSYWANEYATIDLQQRLEMNNCTINNSNSWAIFVRGSGQLICSGTIQTEPSGVTAVNNLTGNGLGPDADCIGGGCTVIFD